MQAGITLNALHAGLAAHNLAMINVGSISDQTLAGIVTTATHGTGMNYKVISTHVLSLILLLADGTRVNCSRQERADLFAASLCGLGSTGLILQIKLEVGPAFRLKEVQESVPFVEVVDHLDTIANASEHVRLWWFPQADVIRVSSADRTQEVIHFSHAPTAVTTHLRLLPPAKEPRRNLVLAFHLRVPLHPVSLLSWSLLPVFEPKHLSFECMAGPEQDCNS